MPTPVGSYVYWSERLVDEVVDHNGLRLDARLKAALKVGVAGSGVDITRRDRERTRFEIAEKIKKRLRRSIISDMSAPAPLRLIQGMGRVEVAEFQSWGAPVPAFSQRTAVTHVRTLAREGRRVDLCLFGGLKNLQGYTIPEDDGVGGWSSSAAPAIEEFIASRGAHLRRSSYARMYDEEGLAVEALTVALQQGIYRRYSEHRDRPETRAFTVMGFQASEYVARIYRDVTLTAGRWNFRTDPAMAGAHRILLGAPLWMRMTAPETMRTYYGANRVVLSDPATSSAPTIASADRPPGGYFQSAAADGRDPREGGPGRLGGGVMG